MHPSSPLLMFRLENEYIGYIYLLLLSDFVLTNG